MPPVSCGIVRKQLSISFFLAILLENLTRKKLRVAAERRVNRHIILAALSLWIRAQASGVMLTYGNHPSEVQVALELTFFRQLDGYAPNRRRAPSYR